jgi:hypothetical protein
VQDLSFYLFIYLFFTFADGNFSSSSNSNPENSKAGNNQSVENRGVTAIIASLKEKFSREPITDDVKKELQSLMDEVKIWNKDRGQYHPKDLLDYQSYDEKTLFSLVQSGDLKAITVLGQKKMDQKQYQDAKLIYVGREYAVSVCFRTLAHP